MRAVNQVTERRDRLRILLAIGTALIEAADGTRKNYMIEEALKLASGIEEQPYRDDTLGEIAMAEAMMGRVVRATDRISLVERDLSRRAFLRKSAVAQLIAGNFVNATYVVASLDDPAERGAMLAAISLAQMDAGDEANAWTTLSRADRIAGGMRPTLDKVRLLSSFSLAVFKLGEEEHARRLLWWADSIAEGLQHWGTREKGFAMAYLAEIKQKEIYDSGKWTTPHADRDWSASIRNFIDQEMYDHALARAEAGEFAEALSSTSWIRSLHWQALTLGTIASAQAEAGDEAGGERSFQYAVDTIKKLDHAPVRNADIAMLSRRMARAGYVAMALRLAATIDESARMLAYRKIFLGVRDAVISGSQRLRDVPGALLAAGAIQEAAVRAAMFACIGASVAANPAPEAAATG